MKTLIPMPEKDPLLGRLNIVGYYRSGRQVSFIFRHGRHAIAVTVELSMIRRADEDDWFEARGEFRVRPDTPLNATWSSSQSATGYGRTEEEAMLAAVDLFTDRLDRGFQSGRVPP